jgi:hypothetical protein
MRGGRVGTTQSSPLFPNGITGQFTYEHLNGNEYILRLKSSIPQTGSAVTTILNFPFHGKLEELRFYHYDLGGVLSNDPLDLAIYSQDGPDWTINQKLDQSTASSGDVSYMDEGGRTFNPTQFKVVSNTTAGHVIKISVRVEVLHE